jgi:hypothetical protein
VAPTGDLLAVARRGVLIPRAWEWPSPKESSGHAADAQNGRAGQLSLSVPDSHNLVTIPFSGITQVLATPTWP